MFLYNTTLQEPVEIQPQFRFLIFSCAYFATNIIFLMELIDSLVIYRQTLANLEHVS